MEGNNIQSTHSLQNLAFIQLSLFKLLTSGDLQHFRFTRWGVPYEIASVSEAYSTLPSATAIFAKGPRRPLPKQIGDSWSARSTHLSHP